MVSLECMRSAQMSEEERGHMGGKRFSWIHVQFIVPTRGPMPGSSPDPDSAVDWGVDFLGSCVSMTFNKNCNLTVNPTSHMKNWFINFCYHKSTQVRKYDQVLPP